MKPPSLNARLRALAETLVRDVLAAVHRGSLRELVEPDEGFGSSRVTNSKRPAPQRRRRRRANRTPREMGHLVDRIGRAVEATPLGLSAGELRAHLALDASAFARPIREAVKRGRIATQGQGRFTVYVAAPAPTHAGAPPPRAPEQHTREDGGRRQEALSGAPA